jgi:hypothetical protein
VHWNTYCTGGVAASIAVVAVIVIDVKPSGAGGDAKVMGSGSGGSQSTGLNGQLSQASPMPSESASS